MHLTIEIYGENRFNHTFDPCAADIDSLCPLRADLPIQAHEVIRVASGDVVDIPSLALGIPDLEGLARLQIFANSTQTQIGCFQAVLTNGRSFAQPEIVSSILGGFTLMAILASFATAIYGLSLTAMRTHHAHSFSVLVLVETLQYIFFSGALSVEWPAVLPAWWSNFAWTAGMMAPDALLSSVGSFTGNNGNVSQVGGAGSTTLNNGGGLLQQIYGRSLALVRSDEGARSFHRRDSGSPYDYTWGGDPHSPGTPTPGTWPGFGGTLSEVHIPRTEAFTIGIIWLMALLCAVMIFIVVSKLCFDILVKTRTLKTDGFDYFRTHWLGFLAAALLRTLLITFFATMTLALHQFSVGGPAGPTAVAAVVCVLLVLTVGGTAVYACYFRLREGKFETGRGAIGFERTNVFKKVPFLTMARRSDGNTAETAAKPRLLGSVPFIHVKHVNNDPEKKTVHEDEGYIKRFGWLSARYRRTRWWFFIFYVFYQFIRACFIGGGAQDPLAQVFGLFVFEVIALFIIFQLNPFEGARNTATAVWMLSICKIITTGLSIAFLADFGISRTAANVLGLIIVVIQAFLALAVLVLVLLGIMSTWLSLSRNREQFPALLETARVKYFENLKDRAKDLHPQVLAAQAREEQLAQRTFNVKSVRRTLKIEDEDAAALAGMLEPPRIGGSQNAVAGRSRANSASSRYSVSSLPRAARTHRASWSSRDFAQWDAEMNRPETQRIGHARSMSLRTQAAKHQQHQRPVSEDIRTYNHAASDRRPMTPTRESLEEPGLAIDTSVNPIEEETIEVSPLTPTDRSEGARTIRPEKGSKAEENVSTEGPAPRQNKEATEPSPSNHDGGGKS